jgi:hypothetical protein
MIPNQEMKRLMNIKRIFSSSFWIPLNKHNLIAVLRMKKIFLFWFLLHFLMVESVLAQNAVSEAYSESSAIGIGGGHSNSSSNIGDINNSSHINNSSQIGNIGSSSNVGDVSSNSNVGDVSSSVGNVEQGQQQSLVYAPTTISKGKPTIFPGPAIHPPGTDPLFIEPGRSINGAAARLQREFMEWCKEDIHAKAREIRKRHRIEKAVGPITFIFEPKEGYISTPQDLARHISVERLRPISSFIEGERYICLGTVMAVTEKKEKSAEKIGLDTLWHELYEFIFTELRGFHEVLIYFDTNSVIAEREISSEGRGWSITPSIAGVTSGGLFGGGPFGFGNSRGTVGTYERLGGMYALVARAHPWNQSSVLYEPPPKNQSEEDEKGAVNEKKAAAASVILQR